MLMSQEDIDKRLKESKVGETVVLHVRYSDLKTGIKIIRTRRYIEFRVHFTVQIELAIDPADSRTLDDKYILFSTDDERKYYKELTVKDDKIEGDKTITLEFDGLKKDLSYSLKIDLGDDGQYYAFTNVPYSSLR